MCRRRHAFAALLAACVGLCGLSVASAAEPERRAVFTNANLFAAGDVSFEDDFLAKRALRTQNARMSFSYRQSFYAPYRLQSAKHWTVIVSGCPQMRFALSVTPFWPPPP